MKLVILGSGGYGRVVADIAAQAGEYEKIVFLDDQDTSEDVLGKCVDFEQFVDHHTCFYPAFGSNQLRVDWIERLQRAGGEVATIVHEKSYISSTAQIGNGIMIMPQSSVGSFTKVKDGTIINMGAIVDHNCIIGTGCHICLGAIVKADNQIPEYMKVETGQVIENRTYMREENGY